MSHLPHRLIYMHVLFHLLPALKEECKLSTLSFAERPYDTVYCTSAQYLLLPPTQGCSSTILSPFSMTPFTSPPHSHMPFIPNTLLLFKIEAPFPRIQVLL